jgi:hypothetical protein
VRRPAAALALALALGPAAAPPPGEALDPQASEALATTLQVLTDPALRAAAIAGNPQAAAAERQARALAGSDSLTEELFAVAAAVFRELTQASGGDAAAMAQALERARLDPGALAATLSPATLERLRRLAGRIADERR